MRFALRRSWWVRPLLVLLGGATGSRSYLEIGGEQLVVRYGWFFNNAIELSNIESVQASRWPLWGGLGLRSNLAGMIAAVASYSGVVEIRLKRRIRAQAILPPIHLSCDRLFVSVERPGQFIEALNRAVEAEDRDVNVR